MIFRIPSITLTQFKDKLLSLTHKIRRSPTSKVKGTESPKFMAFIFSFRSSVDQAHPKFVPF
jgi:hypothetical protein